VVSLSLSSGNLAGGGGMSCGLSCKSATTATCCGVNTAGQRILHVWEPLGYPLPNLLNSHNCWPRNTCVHLMIIGSDEPILYRSLGEMTSNICKVKGFHIKMWLFHSSWKTKNGAITYWFYYLCAHYSLASVTAQTSRWHRPWPFHNP
jgi:hypothetical protein